MAVRFFGLPTVHATWSLDEDATSVDRNMSPSGVPQATITGIGEGNIIGVKGKEIVADSTEYGRTALRVAATTQSAAGWSITANTALSDLNVVGTVKPLYQQPLTACMQRFFDAAKVGSSAYKLQVDASLTGKLYTVPATNESVWVSLRRWLSANELDLCYVFDTLVLYPMRSHTVRATDVVDDWTISVEDGEQIKTIKTYVYNRTPFTKGIVYPPFSTAYPHSDKQFARTDSISTLSVGANEVTEAEIELGAEVSAIGNPTHVLSIPMKNGAVALDTTAYPNGIYAVVGQDNKPITPAQWKAEGGSLTVELQPDGHTAKVTVVGMNNTNLGPFRIAESDGKTDHPALYLVAPSGQYVDIDMVTFDTGAVLGDEEQEIDNPAIDTLTKGYRAAQAAADRSLGCTVTLQWSGSDPVRSPYSDLAMDWAIKTPTARDATLFTGVPLPEKAEVKWPEGTTPAKIQSDLNEFMKDKATTEGRRQSFGRLAGSRFYLRGFWWRIATVSWSDSGVSFTAEQDNTVEDLQRRYATINAWDQPDGVSLLELSTKGIL